MGGSCKPASASSRPAAACNSECCWHATGGRSRWPWTRRARCRSMRRADRRAPLRGFSLIEMLVAVAVLSLVALALLNLAGENTRTALVRSEEHTSELQSLMRISYAVFCLKKKNTYTYWIRQ